MTDDSDDDEVRGQIAMEVLRANMGPIFKELEEQFLRLSGAFPDDRTWFVPVLLIGIVHNNDEDADLFGTAVSAPVGLSDRGIRTILSEALDQANAGNCETMTVLDDGTSVPKKDIQ
jgi:hypothetical protein